MYSHHLLIDRYDKDKKTALSHACKGGNVQVAARLIEAGCAVDWRDRKGQTSLMDASKHLRAHVVSFLLSKNANVNLRDKGGDTCLHHIANVDRLLLQGKKKQLQQIVHELIQHKADIRYVISCSSLCLPPLG